MRTKYKKYSTREVMTLPQRRRPQFRSGSSDLLSENNGSINFTSTFCYLKSSKANHSIGLTVSMIDAGIPVTCKCEFHAVRPQKYSFLSFSQEHDGGRPYMCTPLRSNSKHRCNCWLTDSVNGPPILHFNPFVARTRNGEKPTSNSV